MNKTLFKIKHLLLMLLCILNTYFLFAQSNNEPKKIGDFISVDVSSLCETCKRSDTLTLPYTHTFQKIIKNREAFSDGSIMNFTHDFTGYMPNNGSSSKGYLTINNEKSEVGGAAVLDIEYINKAWEISNSVNLNFSGVGGSSRNCSGAITPWGTVISSEEHDVRLSYLSNNKNNEGYFEFGWQIEINPATKQVLGKRYAMGNFAHENAAIHPNQRTVYQGADERDGFLYKFVANSPGDLSSGNLYVYKAYSAGEVPAGVVKNAVSGRWLRVKNTTVEERNSVREQAKNLAATEFSGIEDVEVGPEGLVYFAVKGEESAVYFLRDVSPIPTSANAFQFVNFKGVYVGTISAKYTITRENGTTYLENWRNGNDNLAFDNDGNLYVLQDGGRGHIWMVESGHTASNPKVKLFAITPNFSEPTGITFSPDNKFMFLSFQLKSDGNAKSQLDALGEPVVFDNHVTVVIARKENLGETKDPVEYCNTKGNNVKYEYIDKVEFAGINYTTGPNQGYRNFTNTNAIATVSPGSTLPIHLTAGYTGSAYTEYWKVWVDFNCDGDFSDSGENIFSASGKGKISGSATIPSNISNEQTTMRIAMKWNSFANNCGTFSYGEVEDYPIVIDENAAGKIISTTFQQTEKLDFVVFPNPSSDFINIEIENLVENISKENNIELIIYDALGKLKLKHQYTANENIQMNIQSLNSNQLYFIHLSIEGNKPKVARFLKQ